MDTIKKQDVDALVTAPPEWRRCGHRHDLFIGQIAVAFVAFAPPFEGADGPWYGSAGQGSLTPFGEYFDSEDEAKEATYQAAIRLLAPKGASALSAVCQRAALEWMSSRDDRNGSLPEAYREIIDGSLGEGPMVLELIMEQALAAAVTAVAEMDPVDRGDSKKLSQSIRSRLKDLPGRRF